VRGITVRGKYAYVASGRGGLKVFDVSNPSKPRLVGSYKTEGFAIGVDVEGTLLI